MVKHPSPDGWAGLGLEVDSALIGREGNEADTVSDLIESCFEVAGPKADRSVSDDRGERTAVGTPGKVFDTGVVGQSTKSFA